LNLDHHPFHFSCLVGGLEVPCTCHTIPHASAYVWSHFVCALLYPPFQLPTIQAQITLEAQSLHAIAVVIVIATAMAQSTTGQSYTGEGDQVRVSLSLVAATNPPRHLCDRG
jgi:hypothetical protein